MTEYYIVPKTKYGTPDFNNSLYYVDGGYTDRAVAERTLPLYVSLFTRRGLLAPDATIVEVTV